MSQGQQTAIFIGMKHFAGRVSMENGAPLRMIHAKDAESALREFESNAADVFVIDSSLEGEKPGGFLANMRERFPDFRTPVVVVSMGLPPHRLIIHEWNPAIDTFSSRMATLKNLSKEVERLCDRPFVLAEHIPELREIGFASNIEEGESVFHIQTEVMTARGVKIKTTILNRGVVVDSMVHKEENPSHGVVAKVTTAARRQHNSAVRNVRDGKYV